MRWMKLRPWMLGLALPLLAFLGVSFKLGWRHFFVPGTTTDGHHLMEESCNSCHSPFAGVSNDRCSGCHRAELAGDTHPPALFDDPRWAADLEKMDVSSCATCHAEHHGAKKSVTVPRDFCFACHSDMAERASHRGFAPATCGNAGCHNYHDGSVLRQETLAAHQGEPDLLAAYGVPARVLPAVASRTKIETPDPPAGLAAPQDMVAAWRRSAHARAGVTCSSCHERSGRLVQQPAREVCRSCHGFEADTFLAGKHGLRTRLGLSALRPRDARLPMKAEAVAGPRHLDCATCHDPHSVDTRAAARQACLGCHDDRHSRSFASSPHARTAGPAADGRWGPRDVTCATCHLPRMKLGGAGGLRVAVNHNNSLTLSPPDRMAAMVCGFCHGLEFSLASLLDQALGENNFSGHPKGGLKSFIMLNSAAAPAAKGR